jgi:hypothetical protein
VDYEVATQALDERYMKFSRNITEHSSNVSIGSMQVMETSREKKFPAETIEMLHGLDIVDVYYRRVTMVIGMNAVEFLKTEAF